MAICIGVCLNRWAARPCRQFAHAAALLSLMFQGVALSGLLPGWTASLWLYHSLLCLALGASTSRGDAAPGSEFLDAVVPGGEIHPPCLSRWVQDKCLGRTLGVGIAGL